MAAAPTRTSCHQSTSSTRPIPMSSNHALTPSGTTKRGLPAGVAASRRMEASSR